MYKALFSHKEISDVPEYYSFVSDLLRDSAVQKLAEFPHHKGTTRLQHSLNVSYYNYLFCRRLHLDRCSAARAGLLHDLFLYDRHDGEPAEDEGGHCRLHPKVAFYNAAERFPLNDCESDMILKHMWPMTPQLPKYRETWVIQLVDKLCAMGEVCAHAARFSRRKLRLAGAFSLMVLVKLTIHF